MSAFFDDVTTTAFFDELQSIAKEAGMFEWAGKKVHKAGKDVVKKVKEEKELMGKVMREMNRDQKLKRRMAATHKHLGIA